MKATNEEEVSRAEHAVNEARKVNSIYNIIITLFVCCLYIVGKAMNFTSLVRRCDIFLRVHSLTVFKQGRDIILKVASSN